MDTTTPGQRLDAAITETKSSYAALAAQLGVTRSAIGHWASGRRDLDVETITRAAAALRIRAAWLAFGDGPMSDDAPTVDSDEHASATATALDGTPTHNNVAA